MSSSQANLRPPNELGPQLRAWRDTRGKSQLELSLDTGISQRQISFIESGRSTPGRQNVLRLADALDVPFRERNTLLLAAGYAPIYSEGSFDDREMQGVAKALKRMLHQHEPFPAVVMDRYWNVLMANDATLRFFGRFIDMATRPAPRNLLHLMFDPAGMRPFIPDWDETAKSLLGRVFREAVGRVIDARTKELVDSLLAYPDVNAEWRISPTMENAPLIPLSFMKDGHILRFFSLVTTVGTAQMITTQELRIECMFPMDEATEAQYAELMNPTEQ
ncbi:helix-turn-helix domain-containing protein [Rhizobium sp. NPDC090279]|uniref:helix-turn-helix domain-containing protein n=1 Tax=Rhizobium sp. NPDC090279 TaxID=3364499 RepID=UPI00383A0F20